MWGEFFEVEAQHCCVPRYTLEFAAAFIACLRTCMQLALHCDPLLSWLVPGGGERQLSPLT